MKKKKNVLVFVGAALVALGLLLAVPTAIMGAASGFGRTEDGYFLMGERYKRRTGGQATAEKEILVHENNIPAFSSIDINVAYSDIRFETAAEPGIKLEYKENNPVEWTVQNGTLTVIEKRKMQGSRYMSVYVDLGFIFPTDRQSSIYVNPFTPKVIIYLPEKTDLALLNVNTENSSFVASGFSAQQANIKNNYGSILLNNISFGTAVFSAENCNININGLDASTLNMKNNYGSIYLENSTLGNVDVKAENCDFVVRDVGAEVLNIKNNYGKASFAQTNIGKLDLSAENCDVTVNNCEMDDITMENSYGTISTNGLVSGGFRSKSENCIYTLDGSFAGQTVIDTSYGDVKLKTDIARSEYGWKINTKYGNVTLDGERKEESTSNEAQAENSIIIDGDSANVNILFAG